MSELFEKIDIVIDESNSYCMWSFKYKGHEFGNLIKTENVEKETQIVVIEDMIKTMKKFIMSKE